ncbi:hypothetical protein FRX31_034363 [Thalictrum thalictroides]|uniref:Uncharacterized protein n=1 Tax=Thalictrum thalictroides TaxID=46969 RepID=A0A7J6UUY2_THATH|nr:hypothetical protein FRX31_034363 [Thalictrum thalictroides]
MSMLSTDADDVDHDAITKPTFEQCIKEICMPKCLKLPGSTESICQNSCNEGCLQASRGHLLLNHLHEEGQQRMFSEMASQSDLKESRIKGVGANTKVASRDEQVLVDV